MRLGRISSLFFGLVGLIAPLVGASDWRSRTFELRQDRLYFPAGEEVRIFENAPFAIVRDGDTVATGLIEHSWEGVSVTALTAGLFDTLALDGLEALISQADIDSTQTIKIGSELGNLTLLTDTTRSNLVRLIRYDDTTAMHDDFAAGLLDAVVTFSDTDFRPGNGATLSVSYPFVAVIMPHVGRPFNYRGELTTSLYYRFDDTRLALCFRGDNVTQAYRLITTPVGSSALPRWYDFDPSRGKKLLDRISPKPARVRLYSGHQTLDGLIRYFADILARDRRTVEVTDDRRPADVRIEYIPYDELSPRSTIDTLLRLMQPDSIRNTPPAEYLRRIESELAQLNTSFTPVDSSRHLETIDRIMAEDLGLFPLFRPTIYVHTHKRLRNVTLTPDGQVDCSMASIVRLPAPPEGAGR